jgi:hypothetical protein
MGWNGGLIHLAAPASLFPYVAEELCGSRNRQQDNA